VAGAPAGAVDAPASQRPLALGPLCRRPPAGNSDLADACARYRALLADQATFASATVEELPDAGALPAPTVAALRDRYLPGC
jgi:hypothetical protein